MSFPSRACSMHIFPLLFLNFLYTKMSISLICFRSSTSTIKQMSDQNVTASDKTYRFISDPTFLHKETLSGRVTVACVTCRRKKIKCSGEVPCKQCLAKETLCGGLIERKRHKPRCSRRAALEYSKAASPSLQPECIGSESSNRDHYMDLPNNDVFQIAYHDERTVIKSDTVDYEYSSVMSTHRHGSDFDYNIWRVSIDPTVVNTTDWPLSNSCSYFQSVSLQKDRCDPYEYDLCDHVDTPGVASSSQSAPGNSQWTNNMAWQPDDPAETPNTTNSISAITVQEQQVQTLRQLALQYDSASIQNRRWQTVTLPTSLEREIMPTNHLVGLEDVVVLENHHWHNDPAPVASGFESCFDLEVGRSPVHGIRGPGCSLTDTTSLGPAEPHLWNALSCPNTEARYSTSSGQ